MTIFTGAVAVGMLLMTGMIAGCDRHEDRARGTEGAASTSLAPTASPASDEAANESAPPAPKSIIRPTVTEPPAPPPIETERLTISFADRGLALDEGARGRLDALMDSRTMRAGGPIILRGHSDSRGHDGDNLVVSRKRAEAVRAYLEAKGVPLERMSVIALGETRPVAPNANLDGSDDPEGRARNRRVEIEIQPPPPAPEKKDAPA